MKVKDIVEKLGLKVCSGHSGLDREVKDGYTSDLLSDVMGNAPDSSVWITLQTHKNIMAIASLKDLAAIILVKNLQPDEDTREESEEESIPILSTEKQAFEITGEVYELLKNDRS